jgi:hypothetical protein
VTNFSKWFSIRSLAIRPVLAIVLGVGLLGFHTHTTRVQAQGADPGRTGVILNWFAARNLGDDRAAAQMFADTTNFVSASSTSTCSMQTPCLDPESAWLELQSGDAGAHYCVTVTSIQANGSTVTGRYEVRSDISRSRGIEHTVNAFTADVRDGKIVSFLQWSDQADALTAQYTAIADGRAAAGAPIATPNPVCDYAPAWQAGDIPAQ